METSRDLLRALGAGWWIAPVVLVASLGTVAWLTADDAPPVYEATATLAVIPHPSMEDENYVLRSVNILERRTMISTLSRIPTSGSVQQRAARRGAASPDELARYRVDTSVFPDTHLIRVEVQGPDPETTSRLANSVADVARVEARGYYHVFTLRFVERAEPPSGPVDEGETRIWAVAGILGLFLGLGGAVGVGALRLG